MTTTTLAHALTPADQSITLAAAEDLTSGQLLALDAEYCRILRALTPTQAIVQRGVNGTQSAAHAAGVTVSIDVPENFLTGPQVLPAFGIDTNVLTGLGPSDAATFQPGGGGGGGNPALPFTSVQFNNSGAFGGSANFTWDGTHAFVGASQLITFSDLASPPPGTALGSIANPYKLLSTDGPGVDLTFTHPTYGYLVDSAATIYDVLRETHTSADFGTGEFYPSALIGWQIVDPSIDETGFAESQGVWGVAQIPSTNTHTTNTVIAVRGTARFDGTGDIDTQFSGAQFEAITTQPVTAFIEGATVVVDAVASGGARGMQIDLEIRGNTPEIYGFMSQPNILVGTSSLMTAGYFKSYVSATASVGDMVGSYIATAFRAAGATITNNYGILIKDQSGVGATTRNENIRSMGASSVNIFEGTVTATDFIGGTWQGKSLTLANSFTTSGNFSVTQTYTGPTNVTFPTSGTLSTTTGTVTSIATTSPISGGTITSTGTISLLVNTDFNWTAGQTITAPAGSKALTLAGGTQTSSFPALDVSQTWNASGTTFTLAKLTATTTASAAGSLLLDLWAGSTPASVFSVSKTGSILLADFQFISAQSTGTIIFGNGGTAIRSSSVALGSANTLSWTSSPNNAYGGTVDIILARDAANTLAIRNSTTAQTFNLYNTFTTIATAGEWAKFTWASNQFRFGAVAGSSSGTNRAASWDYGDKLASATAAITVPATSGNIVFGGGVQLSNAATTSLTPGVLAASTNASIVLYDSGGQAYRVPCII